MTEQEELLMLRKLVEKQQIELAQKNHDILKKEQDILKKAQTIEKLNIQLENMLQALLNARKKLLFLPTHANQGSLEYVLKC